MFNLQKAIVVAFIKRDFTETIRLQHTLVSNSKVRVLAIRRAATNFKAKTSRIDEIVWKADLQKIKVIF